MQSIKQQLLSTGQFINNEALALYAELIQRNVTQKRIARRTDKHHILPESLFSSRGLPENNTEKSIVNLFFADHILAHYYLWQAAKENSDQKYYNAAAVQLLARREPPESKQQLIASLPEYQQMREEYIQLTSERMTGRVLSHKTRQKLSASRKGKPLSAAHLAALRNRKPRSDTSNMKKPKSAEAKLHMSLAKLGKSNGPHKEETKQKISATLMGHPVSDYIKEKSREANLGKKCLYKDGEYKWFYTKTDISEALANGWIIKGIPRNDNTKGKMKQLHAGRIWITNGEETKQIFPEDLVRYEAIGYKKGRKKKIN